MKGLVYQYFHRRETPTERRKEIVPMSKPKLPSGLVLTATSIGGPAIAILDGKQIGYVPSGAKTLVVGDGPMVVPPSTAAAMAVGLVHMALPRAQSRRRA